MPYATAFAKTAQDRADYPAFDPGTDLILAQYDSFADADDIHAQASFGSMLLHPDLDGVNAYAVLGATGDQDAEVFRDSSALMELIYGPQGDDTWTLAWDGRLVEGTNWQRSVSRVAAKAKATLLAGGDVFIAEAGQSNITADWIQALIDDGVSETLIKSNVVVVQHSSWNENHTTASDLSFVQSKASYIKIDDGNTHTNGNRNKTPGYRSEVDPDKYERFWMEEALDLENPNTQARALWELAAQIIHDSGWTEPKPYNPIPDGVDFSDNVEVWWILALNDTADTLRKFWDRYVVNKVDTPGDVVPPSGPSVESFTLVNATTNQPVDGFDPIPDNAIINTGDIGTTNLNILANVEPDDDFGSVVFSLSGTEVHNQTESVMPFVLFGDAGSGDYNDNTFDNGTYTLAATPYDENGGNGNAGETVTIQFTITDQVGPILPEVLSVSVGGIAEFDGITGSFTWDTSIHGSPDFTITANTSIAGDFGSVNFSLSGASEKERSDKSPAWKLNGKSHLPDDKFNYGDHFLEITPYLADGSPGVGLTINFTVEDSVRIAYETWKASHGLTNPTVEDADGDGVKDFFEYLSDSDPNDPSSKGFKLAASAQSSGAPAIIEWAVAEDHAIGLDYIVEASEDLSEWVALDPSDYTLTESVEDGMRTASIELHSNSSKNFIRLSQP
ncbi:MAG: hypothetical protein ACPGN3_07535 [Opitutales bacterium]